jgi:hypothetical protein
LRQTRKSDEFIEPRWDSHCHGNPGMEGLKEDVQHGVTSVDRRLPELQGSGGIMYIDRW